MESVYSLKVNGEFVTKVAAKPGTDLATFKAFIVTFGVAFDDAKDTLEVECLDKPMSPALPFRTNPFMQTDVFAVETHIDNLINTFGIDMVTDVLNKRIGRAA